MSREIYIVCVSGTYERLQMAGMIASVAAVSGDSVSVFFSMNSLAYFIKDAEQQAPSEGPFGQLMEQKDVPPFKQLFTQAADLGEAKLLPCSMAMDIMELEADQLEPEFEAPTGLTNFLGQAERGQLLTF